MEFINRILPAPRTGGFAMEDYWVWCGSVVKGEDGRYHMFASRWPRSLPFLWGYLAASEIVRAVAEAPAGPYRFAEVVLPDRGPGYWDGRMTHNPTIHRYGDHYLLFYIGGTYSGPRPTAETIAGWAPLSPGGVYDSVRIGLATSVSVSGPWERLDRPVLAPRPGAWDARLVSNPAACILDDGRILLYYRSNTPRGLRLGVAATGRFTEPFERLQDQPVLEFPDGCYVEDPYVWREDGHIELIAKDCTGALTGEKYAGVHARSQDGRNWVVSEPPKAYSRTLRWDDGSTTTLGCLERPQLLIENGAPAYLFAAAADGPGGFKAATRTWTVAIPLQNQTGT